MHPLKQLRKILNETSPNHGKVVSAGNELRVSTRNGLLTLQPSVGDATRYRVGDQVIMANGQVVGRRLNQPTQYVL